MGAEPHPAVPDEDPSPTPWRERLVARAMGHERDSATDVTVRVVDASMALMTEVGGDFTVQDVTDRSGVSRRRFYQHFASKDDLLLAMFASIGSEFVTRMRAGVDEEQDPVERVRRFLCWDPDQVGTEFAAPLHALSVCQHRLREARPASLDRALQPARDELVALLAECQQAGMIVSPLPDERIAAVVLAMFNDRMIRRWLPSADPDAFDEQELADTWSFVSRAIFDPSLSATS